MVFGFSFIVRMSFAIYFTKNIRNFSTYGISWYIQAVYFWLVEVKQLLIRGDLFVHGYHLTFRFHPLAFHEELLLLVFLLE